MSGRRGSTMAIVQARMSSTRLPGKVLLPLAGKPMIVRELERIARAARIDRVVVATSTDSSDDEIASVVEAAGFDVIRGALDDVLDRFTDAIEIHQPDVVVRITADCPLISPAVIDQVIEQFHESDADYVSNTMDPTFPDGLDVEVVSAEVLTTVAQSSTDPHEREHVTLGVYRRVGEFTIENVKESAGRDLSHLRWTVDTEDDYRFVERIYSALSSDDPAFDYEQILQFLDRNQEVGRTEADSARNAALDGLDTGAMRHRRQDSES